MPASKKRGLTPSYKPSSKAPTIRLAPAGRGAPRAPGTMAYQGGMVRKPSFKAPMKKGSGYGSGVGRGPARILPTKRGKAFKAKR
jgi:hypothetical protein